MTSSTKSLWTRVVLLGDSITEGSFSSDGRWGAMLANSLQRLCDVIPRGFGGYNSRQWLSVCRDVPVMSLYGDVAVLFLGANDACTNPQQYVPIEEYKTNLAFIVNYMKSTVGVPEVVILTPPPCDTTAMSPEMASERSEEMTANYAEACVQEALELGVPYIDLHTLFKEQSDWQSLLIDGLHLTERGSTLLHSALLPVVKPLAALHGPQNMEEGETILPSYTDASNTDPSPEIEAWVVEHPMPDEAKNQAK
ncbi:SGNH hydrolase-type esterase domain [Trinorchestia longiramus]|nr:SGNH hydrolase-type esterase domain [Trinorchestia longiramus]